MAFSKDSSGQVGLGSRLFLGKESTWGTVNTANWAGYSVYNQPGGRPQKTMTPIDIPQLFPSMLRRKPLAGAVSVAGSYVFGLPKTNFKDFCELILGDTSQSVTAETLTITAGAGSLTNEDWAGDDFNLVLKLDAMNATVVPGTALDDGTNVAADWEGIEITLSNFDVDSTSETDAALENIINSTHKVLSATLTTNGTVVLDTILDLATLSNCSDGDVGINLNNVGSNGVVAVATISERNVYSLQERNTQSWSMIQTLGIERVALYTGMKAQSATINVTADSIATIDVAFLGKDESTQSANANDGTASYFGSVLLDPLTYSGSGADKVVSGVAAGYDNFTDYFPSWSAKLFVGKKDSPSDTLFDIVAGGGTQVANIAVDNHIIPFSDFSITINNNLDFPAYINGTQARNEPVQTTYKEVTGSMTIPFNEHTEAFIDGFFNQTHYKAILQFNTGDGASVKVDLPEFCVVGDGGLGNIPEGEITLPVSFGAYASVDASDTYADTAPVTITVDETTAGTTV